MAEVVPAVRPGRPNGEEAGGPLGIQVPEGVRDAIGQRLNRISDQCNQALTLASVIGREFSLGLLGQLSTDQSEDWLLAALEELYGADVEAHAAELARHFAEALAVTGAEKAMQYSLLAETMGNLDRASHHFEATLTASRQADYRHSLAWSLCDYADLLLAPSTSSESALSPPKGRADPENRQKAMAMLGQSLAISSELGMTPLMQRVLSRREILKA